HFRGKKELVADAELGRQIADYRLGATVHRRAVDEPPATRDEAFEHGPPRRVVDGIHIECLPGAEADDGKRLTSAWNRTDDHPSTVYRLRAARGMSVVEAELGQKLRRAADR